MLVRILPGAVPGCHWLTLYRGPHACLLAIKKGPRAPPRPPPGRRALRRSGACLSCTPGRQRCNRLERRCRSATPRSHGTRTPSRCEGCESPRCTQGGAFYWAPRVPSPTTPQEAGSLSEPPKLVGAGPLSLVPSETQSLHF